MDRAEDVARPPEERRAALAEAFRRWSGRPPEGVAQAPGRVNLIGEHVDYNEGLVLPVAIDRSVFVAFARRDDGTCRVWSLDFDQVVTFPVEGAIDRDDAAPWSNYVRGVVWALGTEGYRGPGVDLAITGDVPQGAGLSSSAALEVATLGALRAAWGLAIDGRSLALLAQRAEREFVGVQCGIMDQFTASLARAEHALLIDCRTLDYEAVPLPFDAVGVALVVVDTGLPRRLEESAYNQRRAECAEALERLCAALLQRSLTSLRDVSEVDLDAHGDALPPLLLRRARHVVTEIARVRQAVDVLRRGDLETFGALLDASHRSLRDDFEVSCPELDLLVEYARAHPGVLGARLTGAGFGGCTVHLVRADALASFWEEVVGRYQREIGLDGRVYLCRASDGLRLHPPSR